MSQLLLEKGFRFFLRKNLFALFALLLHFITDCYYVVRSYFSVIAISGASSRQHSLFSGSPPQVLNVSSETHRDKLSAEDVFIRKSHMRVLYEKYNIKENLHFLLVSCLTAFKQFLKQASEIIDLSYTNSLTLAKSKIS